MCPQEYTCRIYSRVDQTATSAYVAALTILYSLLAPLLVEMMACSDGLEGCSHSQIANVAVGKLSAVNSSVYTETSRLSSDQRERFQVEAHGAYNRDNYIRNARYSQSYCRN